MKRWYPTAIQKTWARLQVVAITSRVYHEHKTPCANYSDLEDGPYDDSITLSVKSKIGRCVKA